MKWKPDRQYLKISFYVVLTLSAAYISFIVIDSAAFIVTNAPLILQRVGEGLGFIAGVFAALIIAFVVAYVFDPLVDYFQRKWDGSKLKKRLQSIRLFRRKSRRAPKASKEGRRTAGTTLCYLSIALVLGTIITVVAIRVRAEGGLAQGIAGMVSRTLNTLQDLRASAMLTVEGWGFGDQLSGTIESAIAAVTGTIQDIAGDIDEIVDLVAAVGIAFMNTLIALVVAFYFLRDKRMILDKINEFMELFVPERWRGRIKTVGGDAHAVFSGYIRGQLIDGMIMGGLLTVGLTIVGVDLAPLIGIISGFANLIPYVGAFVGFILAVGVCILNGDIPRAIAAGIVVIILQQIDGMFIVPKVVGEKVELSPAHVLLSLSIFGALFGLWGMVFAVPTVAIAKIFIGRLSERRRQKILNRTPIGESDKKQS